MVTVRQLMVQLSALPPDARVYLEQSGERDYDVEVTLINEANVLIY